MSYDLLVFEPEAAPRDRAEFMAWYDALVDWSDDDTPYDLATTSPKLQAWYHAMVADWPDMQVISDDDPDFNSSRVTGYSFARHGIYLDFRWSVADEAYDAVRKLAVEHGVGFFNVSGGDGGGEIYFPGEPLAPSSQGPWREIANDFRTGNMAKYIAAAKPPKRRWFDFFRRK